MLSFIGLLSISGMALAVAVLVAVLSIVNGFEKELKERVLGVLPHGTLYSYGNMSRWQNLREAALNHPDVLGAAPVVEGSGMLIGEALTGVTYRGIDPQLEPSVSILPAFFLSGSMQSLVPGQFSALIGAELASQTETEVGDYLNLALPDVAFGLTGPVVTTRRIKIVGVFRVGADVDKHQVLLHIDDAVRLKRQRTVDGLVLRLTDLFEAPRVIHEIMLAADDHELYGMSWMRRHGTLFDAIQTQKATLFLLLLILVAVAAFNVVSNLVMTVEDRRADIAILRTMGANPWDIRVVFLVHGVIVGCVGLIAGLALGLLLTFSLTQMFGLLNTALDLNLMAEYFIRDLPTEVRISDLLVISAISLFISMVTTLYPAGKAANANPVEALQYDV